MEQRLSIITLGVADLQMSRSFYEGLGWAIATEQQADQIVAFNLQAFVLALFPKNDLELDVGVEMGDTALTPSFTLAYNVAAESEVDRVIEEARAIGATIVKSPQATNWGGYSGYFSDPDGYLWEVAHNPFSELKEDGSFHWS